MCSSVVDNLSIAVLAEGKEYLGFVLRHCLNMSLYKHFGAGEDTGGVLSPFSSYTVGLFELRSDVSLLLNLPS